MAKDVFAVQVFFIVFRECLEAGIILSVLLSFLKQCLGGPDQDQNVYKRLRREVWLGAFVGIFICLILGGAFIGTFYSLGHDVWAQSEDLWEGIFYLVAAIIITVMGLALLRINKMQDKWRIKFARALSGQNDTTMQPVSNTWWTKLRDWSRRHVMFILPFVTTLREGVEAVVFIGGVSLNLPASVFPLPVFCGILAALVIGYLLYRGGNMLSIQIFLIASTCVLYLIAAGMFSKAVWKLQYHSFASRVGGDVAEQGSGPGSYDIAQTVWHVNCCNGETDHGWEIFTAILGWQNTATYGSVLSYIFYWVFLMACIACLMYEEKTGSLPLKTHCCAIMEKVPGLRVYAKEKKEEKNGDNVDMSNIQARMERVAGAQSSPI